jgi:hypothetical protein
VRRWLNFNSFSQEEAEARIAKVGAAFDLAWLEVKGGGHRMQRLWQRTDSIASIELVTLGDSIRLAGALDPEWVKGRVKAIKDKSDNCHGTVFEILTVAGYLRAGMPVHPTQGNAPGIDAVLRFEDGWQVRLSIKNHDISTNEKFFRDEASKTRSLVLRTIGARELALQVLVNAKEVLTLSDWNKVRETLGEWGPVHQLRRQQDVARGKASIGVLRMGPHEGFEAFSSNYRSDSFIAFSAQHKNEQKRFLDGVDKAAANLRSHAQREPKTLNAIVMRVHPSASLELMLGHAETLLRDDPDCGFSAIILHQAAVSRDTQGNSSVTHQARLAKTPEWDALGHPLAFAHLFGTFTTQPTRIQLRSNLGVIADIQDRYFYQAGDHYYLATKTADGWEGNIKAIGPGIRTHLHFLEPAPGMLISGNLPADDELVFI